MSLTPREKRIAVNEASFRDINERLEQGLRQVRHAPELQEFICECGRRACAELISLTFEEYEQVRQDSRRFAVLPGHEIPDAERVLSRTDRYFVVEKIGEAAGLADAVDPRGLGADALRAEDPTP